MCLAFSMILERGARAWYHNLPYRPVEEFNQISQVFIQQFSISENIKKNIASLKLEQKQGESLKNFLRWFTEAYFQTKTTHLTSFWMYSWAMSGMCTWCFRSERTDPHFLTIFSNILTSISLKKTLRSSNVKILRSVRSLLIMNTRSARKGGAHQNVT